MSALPVHPAPSGHPRNAPTVIPRADVHQSDALVPRPRLAWIPEVPEAHTDIRDHGDRSPCLVVSVERHFSDRRYDESIGGKRAQWGLHLCLVAYDHESDRRVFGRYRRGDAVVERIRHVDAFDVPAVRPDITHVVAVERDPVGL